MQSEGTSPSAGKMTVVAKDDVHKFYDDFYRFLSSCGVDGVKTDAQFMMDTWESAEARRELIHTYLDAWTISSLRHFSIKAISCMSQAPADSLLTPSFPGTDPQSYAAIPTISSRPYHPRTLARLGKCTQQSAHAASQHPSGLGHVPDGSRLLGFPRRSQMRQRRPDLHHGRSRTAQHGPDQPDDRHYSTGQDSNF